MKPPGSVRDENISEMRATAAESLAPAAAEIVARTENPFIQVIFDVEGVADAANWVENLWAPGLSGFGAPANRAGVVDIRTPGSTPLRGLFLAHRMNHVDVLRRFLRDGD